MNFLKSKNIAFLKYILILIVIYQICRFLFYIFNKELLDSITLIELLGGLRFDLAAIGYTNILFGFLYFLPTNLQQKAWYKSVLQIVFFAINLLFIATNFVDLEYFKFTSRRSTFNLIKATGMENEIFGLLISFAKDYFYVLLNFLLAVVLLFFITPKFKTAKDEKFTIKGLVNLVVIVAALFLMGRGGLQRKPLRIVDANLYTTTVNSAVVLNTPFSILKTLGNKENLEQYSYYAAADLDDIYNPVYTTDADLSFKKKNVVIIILESFGKENLNIGQTPFLDSLTNQSLNFTNSYANGRVSIDAVPSIISSIPSLMDNSLIASSYSLNKIKAFPEVMEENGYETSFFHGAFNGSQNFDQYCKAIGFNAYYGKNEYEGPPSFDGKWGVFDEDFLQYFGRKVSTFKQPFFTSIFTISSHPPYVIPEKYKGIFPKGTTEIHETIAYSDNALKKFFKSVENKPWYKNTLFVITADHTSATKKEKRFNTALGKFEIPILFFDPSNPSLKGINEKNIQQIDILPSVLDYLGVKTQILTYGKSYLDKEDFIVNYSDNAYNYIVGDYFLIFDGKNTKALYNKKVDKLLQNNLMHKEVEKRKEMEIFIKAYIQSFNDRMSTNRLVVENKV